jgi:hypothetical protein
MSTLRITRASEQSSKALCTLWRMWNAKSGRRWRPKYTRAIFGLIALALLTMTSTQAAVHQRPADVAAHQHKYCRHLSNGDVRICEFDTMKQCKASSSRCERYPFLAYCHISPSGWVQRCDFDTLAECKTSSSEWLLRPQSLVENPRSACGDQP